MVRSDYGWIGAALEGIDSVLDGRVPYSYGFSIIALTVLVKLATFPLSKKQVESSMQMQKMQPRIKELQAMYANDPERLQMEQARLYKEAGFNPLAGCLPVFATLPVFIGLYRALSNAASEGLLTDGFYWIPSLGGPTSIASRNAGSGFTWLWPSSTPSPRMARHRVLPRASGLARRVAVRVPANHQPPTEDGRSGAATKPSHFEVSSAHDWFLLSQRPPVSPCTGSRTTSSRLRRR